MLRCYLAVQNIRVGYALERSVGAFGSMLAITWYKGLQLSIYDRGNLINKLNTIHKGVVFLGCYIVKEISSCSPCSRFEHVEHLMLTLLVRRACRA